MAAATTQNPAARPESKSAKKKKAKSDTVESTTSTPVPAAEVNQTHGAPESSNGDGSYESPYIKELYKNIRNVNKKIANASKVDNILAENPTKSLDELIAARKINADQKAQILKKPTLQASLTQLEEQIAQYKKFDQEYKAKSQAEKTEFEKSFTEKSEKELSDAVAAAKAEGAASATKEQHSNMLLLSQFLRLAAARRADEDAEATKDENMALEGVLLQIYSGDETAVTTMIKLINGSDDNTFSVSDEKLETTFAQVKAAALAHAPADIPNDVVPEESYASPAVETAEYPTESDPTIVHAGLTELDEPAVASMTNGHSDAGAEAAAVGIPQNTGIDEGASNNAAETHWDSNNDLSTSQEWVNVNVPRDITETDTGLTATPAEPSNKQSWADEQPDDVPPSATGGNDGFHEVQRSRGGRDRDGQQRGRGGHHRGRGGPRGSDGGYRGRGRGGPRGGARPRRGDES